MERLFSPWRARHIERMTQPGASATAPNEAGSLFARLAAEGKDEDNLILWRGPHTFVLMNLYPYTNGHLMIVPYREVADYDALTTEEQVEIAQTIGRCMGWLRTALLPDGFNVGINQGSAAGAGIPDHLHVHVVPRWTADTNFMPVVGAVKVIPEDLPDTYRKLRTAIEADAS